MSTTRGHDGEQAHEAQGAHEAIVVACAHCGRKNRVLRARLGEDPRCGHCHDPVFPSRPLAAGDDSFAEEVERSPIPVLVDFWAPWCGPCRAVAPALERIAAARGGRLKVVKVNVDESPRVAARFGIQAIPTMMLFRGPTVVDQIRGALPQSAIEARLARVGL